MNGFTEDKIAAELNRRGDSIKKRDEAYQEALHQEYLSECDTVCLHCGTPVKSYLVTDPENPLCDTCMDY
ncbi:hypothetical protein FHW77_002887 [Agrobacterium sp. RC10-4-1]|uniref:hypothetical protein n=1 Tax=Agrobacterium sp. RC10-4-1 TaxID=2587039 RepID=UPI0015F9677B|nr:hypothetical protein [Agrobacterium sp. RC10-4-1]MBA8799168.1 hypothetical protein [Agrobacterium sp. RC10-4-1]